MSSVVSATSESDTCESENIQYGENNHIEYKWSTIQQENILQLSYQLVRTSNIDNMAALGRRFGQCFEKGTVDEKRLLLRMLAHTRDVECGKGEHALSLVMLKELMSIDMDLSVEMMKRFVGYVDESTDDSSTDEPADEVYKYLYHKKITVPYGSWKDMKYYFNEISSCPDELVRIINNQVNLDVTNMNNGISCSLVSKWIPRETSAKFGWINAILAKDYYYEYGSSGWSSSATRKAQTHYRQLISNINKYIDTTQIKQCGHQWSKIDFNKVTGITLLKQRKAFLNMNLNTEMNNPLIGNHQPVNNDPDRIQCRDNLLHHIENIKQGKTSMKGKRTSMTYLVKAAINVSTNSNTEDDDASDKSNQSHMNTADQDEIYLINEAWKTTSNQIKKLDNVIAMVDTSASMEQDNCNPLYSAIGLGICVAEKSTLGKRIMTFTNKPSWVSLDDCPDFVSSVKKIRDIEWGMNTDFYRAMDLILDTIVVNKIPAEDVENLVLAVFSDMQFDASQHYQYHSDEYACQAQAQDQDQDQDQDTSTSSVKKILEQKYHNAGVKVCGKGYKMPHILFWNLKSTTGFPELSYQDNITMLSGYSPMLLNAFVEQGISGLQNITPWLMLNNMLNKDRYTVLNKLIS